MQYLIHHIIGIILHTEKRKEKTGPLKIDLRIKLLMKGWDNRFETI